MTLGRKEDDMKIIQYDDVKASSYANSGIAGVTARVVIGKKDGANNFCMRVLEFAPVSQSLRHSHDWEHEMFVHAGAGEIYGDGRWNPLNSGSVVFIPGKEEHQIRNLCQEPLIIVCLIPTGAPEF